MQSSFIQLFPVQHCNTYSLLEQNYTDMQPLKMRRHAVLHLSDSPVNISLKAVENTLDLLFLIPILEC